MGFTGRDMGAGQRKNASIAKLVPAGLLLLPPGPGGARGPIKLRGLQAGSQPGMGTQRLVRRRARARTATASSRGTAGSGRVANSTRARLKRPAAEVVSSPRNTKLAMP